MASPPKNKFDQLMFGSRQEKIDKKMDEAPKDSMSDSNEDEDQLEYMKIMMQVDDIMGSLKEMKPMFKKLSPMLDIIKKKFSEE
ncbi:hypothetical protein [Bacillus sp. SJS]|uniref:hypothetical protein n=1 Tax=Bacillus sp. SJS TaxID=1423321 RepID=UPI0004DCE544|nr:hypothetical protein [Bacillus sp. SJS]KZZ83731.1 hypothetical protein AS29_015630 [Bacillus sp. SJS]